MPERNATRTDGPRAFWSGLLSFGLVSIPVELVPAHTGGGSVLRMLDADGTPLARRYYCSSDEQEVSPDELIRGYELENGKVVVVTDEELEALAPKKSREIDLRLFVERDTIDPLYFERSYFLAPGKDSGKAYRLLAMVMERSGRAGIASFVMRDREYLVAIFAEAGLLRAQTLRFAGEVRSSAGIGLPKPVKLAPKQIETLCRSVKAMESKRWSHSGLTGGHDAIRELAEAKFKRKKDVVVSGESTAESGAQIIDLMEVLKKSLAESGLSAKRAKSRTASTARTTAKKSRKPRAARG